MTDGSNESVGSVIFRIACYAYFFGALIAAPYYNWQYAKENGFAKWMLLGEVNASLKGLAWPYFVFVHGPKDNSPPAHPPEAGVDFNDSERERSAKIFAKAKREPLSDSDLKELRSVLQEYRQRTGVGFRREEIDLLKEMVEVAPDYQVELLQSALLSWDNKTYTTTDKFDGLYEKMKSFKEEKLLKMDLDMLHAAAQNLRIISDGQGNRYVFGRETILQGIQKADFGKRNADKIVQVIMEFAKATEGKAR